MGETKSRVDACVAAIRRHWNGKPKVGIILGTDRVLDMCRTATNVGCDVTTALVVDEITKKAEAKPAAGG